MSGYESFESVGACPLCGETRRRVVDTRASVVACRRCGHRFVDPRPTQAEISRGYSLPGAYAAWIDEAPARDRLWRRRFENVLGGVRPGRLLDVGAGIGTFLLIARSGGWEPHGTEVSATAINHAATLGIALTPGELASAAVEGPFDAITLWHVLEHVPEPRATVRRCRELLAPDGRLILAMPNDGGAAMALTRVGDLVRRVLGRPSLSRYLVLAPGVESHLQHFDAGSIARLLNSEGLRIERVDVDDARPARSPLGGLVFRVRRLLTRRTPWHWGREMLVIARPAGSAG